MAAVVELAQHWDKHTVQEIVEGDAVFRVPLAEDKNVRLARIAASDFAEWEEVYALAHVMGARILVHSIFAEPHIFGLPANKAKVEFHLLHDGPSREVR